MASHDYAGDHVVSNQDSNVSGKHFRILPESTNTRNIDDCVLDVNSDDDDFRKSNRQRCFLCGICMLTVLVSMAVLSTVVCVTWAIVASNSRDYKLSSRFAVIVNGTFLGVCYLLYLCIIIPTFWRLYKSQEHPSWPTRFCYSTTLIVISLIHIGTFIASYVQAFGVDDPIASVPQSDSNDTEKTSIFVIIRSVAASWNFFTAVCSYIAILVVYFVVSQNPWRRCWSNGHCVISCMLFNLLIIAVSVFLLLTLQVNEQKFSIPALVSRSSSTGATFGGAFVGFLVIVGLGGGLAMIKYKNLTFVNFVRLVWFVVGGAGCFAWAFISSDAAAGAYGVATMSGFVGVFFLLVSCCTCCYCYINCNHGGRYHYVTRQNFAYFKTGTIREATMGECEMVVKEFKNAWAKGGSPEVAAVFAVRNRDLKQKWQAYRNKLSHKDVEIHFHGSKLNCHITRYKKLCGTNHLCGICNISSVGMERQFNKTNITKFQRFGSGIYLSSKSSKSHDYTQGAHGHRAMLLCFVCPGKKYEVTKSDQSLDGPPPGYDSVYGAVGQDLNYPEIVLPNPDAVWPRYIIVYTKDGVERLIS